MTTKTIASVGLALILTALAMTSLQAREYDRHDVRGYISAQPEPAVVAPVKMAKVVHRVSKKKPKHRDAIPHRYASLNVGERKVVEHPAGCPHRAFCGCGTAKYLLGKTPTEGGLAVAANWLNFPKAACAPNMAAARHGHVFAIIKCLPGNKALAYDPNGGQHKTFIHVRSLASYTVVNPKRSYASAG